jgi:GcrA cell cycle regulator
MTLDEMTIKTYWWDGPGRIELLEKLVGENLSASCIAAALQDEFGERVTRNMVIGKCHRLGISLRGGIPKAGKQKAAPSKPSAPRVRKSREEAPMIAEETKLEPAPILPEIATLEEWAPPAGKTLMQFEPGDCRWPISMDTESRHLFCVAKATGGRPYCEYHAQIAYVPSTKKPPKKIRGVDPVTGRVREKFVRGDDKEAA